MKKLNLIIFLTLSITLSSMAQNIMPFYNCGTVDSDIKTAKAKVIAALKAKSYVITGGYYVANKASMYVLTFTSKELQRACLKVKDRGILASNLRVGFQKVGEKTELSMINPKYMFLGYLRKSYASNKTALDKINNEVKLVMKSFAGQLKPFGGTLKESELKNYHYMTMMPYFTDPVELEEFDSFEEAITTIDKNLAAKKGNTKKVYKLKFTNSKMAVYGVALLDKEEGEGHFLPIVGKKHFTAMPYEIVVIGKTVTMLHGKFRFAMYWPDLTMGTFTKIISTPGDVEDALEALMKK